MKNMHTKAPWEARGNKIFKKGTYNGIAVVCVQEAWDHSSYPIEDHTHKANLKLIESAPVMYETLVHLRKLMTDNGGQAPANMAIAIIDEAITQAHYTGFELRPYDKVEFRVNARQGTWDSGTVMRVDIEQDLVFVDSGNGKAEAVNYKGINIRKIKDAPAYITMFSIGQYVVVKDIIPGQVDSVDIPNNIVNVYIGNHLDNERIVVPVEASFENIRYPENGFK